MWSGSGESISTNIWSFTMKISTFVGLSDPSRLSLLVTVDNVIRYLPGSKMEARKMPLQRTEF